MASKREYVAKKNLFSNVQLEEELVIPLEAKWNQ
jgi:hypothetical protein